MNLRRVKAIAVVAAAILVGTVACSDKEDLSYRDGLLRSVEGDRIPVIFKPSLLVQAKFEFEYDQQGRVRKVGDRVFYYGANGKVNASRIHRTSGKNTYAGEAYIERLSYHWDGNGRLKDVVLDSLYIKNSMDPDAETISVDGEMFQHLVTGVKIAEFTYQGSNTAPSTIAYRDIIRKNADLTGGMETLIVPVTEIFFEYDGANVKLKKGSYIRSDPRWGDIEQTNLVYSQYTDRPHFLYAAYQQLGFHPFVLYDVVPANLESATIWQTSDVQEPDWSSDFIGNEYEFDALDRVIEIRVRGGMVYQSSFSVRYY